MLSAWDATLPFVQLTDVSVEADSLVGAWINIGKDYLLRSVLYLSEDTPPNGPSFSFAARRCTASQLFDALVATYTDMTWTQDKRTGVVWFHPRNIPYANILSIELRFPSTQLGVPMLNGVLEPIRDRKPHQIGLGPRRGASYAASHNYPVNVPEGTYTVRHLLNICCTMQPSATFFIRPDFLRPERDKTYISPLGLYPGRPQDEITLRAGALHWWTTHFGPLSGRAPQTDEIVAKLASLDPGVRSAARAYLLATVEPYTENMIRQTDDPVSALWVCLAHTDIHVRMSQALAGRSTIARMKKVASEEFLMTCDP